jgi:hypothetical protein
MMKQHAVFFIAFGVIYFIWTILWKHPFNLKRLAGGTGLLILASAIPFIVSCTTLYAVGVFSRFWFWTFIYAHQYVSEATLTMGIQRFMISAPRAVNSWGFLWTIAGIGLTTIFWNEKARSNWFFLIGSTLFSFLTVCPGFIFRNHYFVTLLPGVALLAGVATSASTQFLFAKKMPSLVQILPVLVVGAAIIGPVFTLSGFFFRATPVEACRMMYGVNPFPESIEIGKYIKNHSAKDDKIAVLGSEPQIYFYANRKSATGYIYVYGLMEPQDYASEMQLEMIHEIEKARPRYAIIINVPTSWLRILGSDTTIFKWAEMYFGKNYQIAGFVDIIPGGDCRAYWDDEARRNRPISQFNLYLLERREG